MIVVGLVEAAKYYHVDAKRLSQLLDAGAAPYLSRELRGARGGRRWAYKIDLEELGRYLRSCWTCRETGCEAVTLGENGYCTTHKTQGAAQAEARQLADPDRTWWTFGEVEALLGYSQHTVQSLIDDGVLAAKKVSRFHQVTKASVEALRVSGYEPRKPGVWKQPRRPDPDLPARRADAKRRYEAGESTPAIAEAMGVGRTTVRRWLGVERVEMRSGAPPTKYPRRPARNCELCKQPLSLKPPSQDRRRNGDPREYHAVCWQKDREQRSIARVHDEPGDWITVKEAAAEIGYGRRYVLRLCRGPVVSKLIHVDGELKPIMAVSKKSLRKWRAREAREQPTRASIDGRSAVPADPDRFIASAAGRSEVGAIMRRDGLDQAAAESRVRRRVEDREKLRDQIRAGGDLGGRRKQADTDTRVNRIGRRWAQVRPTTTSDRQAEQIIFESEWQIDEGHFPRDKYPASPEYSGLPHPDTYEKGRAQIRRLRLQA